MTEKQGQTTFLLQEDRQGVRILTMNRPDKRNALNAALAGGLLAALQAADSDDSIGALVLTGAGPGFCAGADLEEFRQTTDPAAGEKRAELTMQLHLAFPKISKPIVTAINGAAMGGGAGLAIAGDLAVMAEGAKLGYPETRHGIVAAIVMANLVRQVGRKAAFELVSLGEPVDAARALQLGLVNQVVPAAEVLQRSISLAEKLAAVHRPAMAETKRLFHQVADLPFETALDRARETNVRMRNFRKLGESK
jgi:enoyl-CoA hydratase/carnithine racemase